MFSEVGGSVQVQGSPRAGVAVATYESQGNLFVFQTYTGPTSTSHLLLPAFASHGTYVLKRACITPRLTGASELILFSNPSANICVWDPTTDLNYDLGGLPITDAPVSLTTDIANPQTIQFSLWYDLIYEPPGIS